MQETCAKRRGARLLVDEKPATRLAEIVRRLVVLVDHGVGVIAAHKRDPVARRAEKLVEMRLSEAYKQFAASLFQELNSLDAEFSRANQFRSEIPVAQ